MSWARRAIAAAGLLVLLVTAGCAHRGRPLVLIPYEMSGTIDSLPEIERGIVAPQTDRLADLATLDLTLRRPVGEEYRALTPVQAQCLAAAESPLGNLLSRERSAVQPRGGICHGNERAVGVMRRALSYAAAEARNRSAGDALEAYYRLIEVEGGRDLLRESSDTLGETLRELAGLRERGVTVPAEAYEVERQDVELEERRVEAELNIVRLNAALRELTGLHAPDERILIWPVAELNVSGEPIDIDLAVAEGLQLRPELNLLRYVERQLDLDTLPVARQVLGGVTGILGASPEMAKCCSLVALAKLLCGSPADESELAARRRQLRQYRQDRERSVEAEIRQAVFTVEARVKQVAIAKRRVAETQQEAADADERQQAGRGSFLEVTAAELTAIQARADLLSAVVAWELARVELRQAQGLLIFECGSSGICP